MGYVATITLHTHMSAALAANDKSTRLKAALALSAELRSERAQARSQALHTFSKIKDPRTWPAITRSLLRDADD